MVDRNVLKEAQKLGHNLYLDGKKMEDKHIPWPDTDEYQVYRRQMKASYEEAETLFKQSKTITNARTNREVSSKTNRNAAISKS